MRVTFPRLPDHQRAYALVERDDGMTCRRDGGIASPRLPHAIVHLIVERELRIGDGIWGSIAAGIAASSAQRRRAEQFVDLVSAAASLDAPTPAKIRRLAAVKLPGAEFDPAVITVAAQALQVEAARWARLRIGEDLTYDWPHQSLDKRPG
jgi:hypothetical protein